MKTARTVDNLVKYWLFFRSRELPKKPQGIETVISDTIEALQEYKKLLTKKEGGPK